MEKQILFLILVLIAIFIFTIIPFPLYLIPFGILALHMILIGDRMRRRIAKMLILKDRKIADLENKLKQKQLEQEKSEKEKPKKSKKK